MSSLGSVEPLSCGVVTPRERATQEYLQSASRVLSRQQLRDIALNTQRLHTEFVVSDTNTFSINVVQFDFYESWELHTVGVQLKCISLMLLRVAPQKMMTRKIQIRLFT